jgi:hypothetical protein
MTGAAPDVQNPHAWPDAGLTKDLQREGPDELRLLIEPLELALGMAELIVDRAAGILDGEAFHCCVPLGARPRSLTGSIWRVIAIRAIPPCSAHR